VYPSTALQTSFLVAGLVVDNAYIIVLGYDLPCWTDKMKLKEAFEGFINHSNGMMFRTLFSFEPVSARWLQVLVRPGAKRMEWTTVIVADEAELELRVGEYRRGGAIQPFKDGELLTRICIFELDGYPRVLVWSLHHALTDHWVIDSYLSDIEDTYACRPLPPRRPFKPMIKYLEHLDRTTGLEFWRSHLQDATPTPFLLSLPGSRRVIAEETVLRNVHVDHISLTRRFGIMASTLVTAAWSIVLAAHSNCTDVVFGQVLSGRSMNNLCTCHCPNR
jgi:Condensation domain